MKPSMTSFGRKWPLDEIPQIDVRATFPLPGGSRAEIKADIERRLAGMNAEVEIKEVTLLQIPEPQRTEYHKLQDEAYREAVN